MFLMETVLLPLGNRVSYNRNRIIISQMKEKDFKWLFFTYFLYYKPRYRPQGNVGNYVVFLLGLDKRNQDPL